MTTIQTPLINEEYGANEDCQASQGTGYRSIREGIYKTKEVGLGNSGGDSDSAKTKPTSYLLSMEVTFCQRRSSLATGRLS